MCEHKGCHCEHAAIERRGKKYCSEACATADTTGHQQTTCNCGHPDCTTGA